MMIGYKIHVKFTTKCVNVQLFSSNCNLRHPQSSERPILTCNLSLNLRAHDSSTILLCALMSKDFCFKQLAPRAPSSQSSNSLPTITHSRHSHLIDPPFPIVHSAMPTSFPCERRTPFPFRRPQMDAPSVAVHKFQVRFRDGIFFHRDPEQLVLDIPATQLTIASHAIKFYRLEVSVGFFAHDTTLRDTYTNQLITIRAFEDIDAFNILRAHLCFLTHVPLGYVPLSLLPSCAKTSVLIEAFPQNDPDTRVVLKHTRRTDLHYLGIPTQEFLAARNALKDLPAHPNISPILAVRRTSDALVTVLPKSSSTFVDFFSDPKPSMQTLLSIARDILAGIAHIHAHGVIHRNICPEHILIDGQSSPTALLCGFSHAYRVESKTSLSTGLHHKLLSRVPPTNFCAPELSATSSEELAGHAADVWAAGILLYLLFLRRYPWGRDQDSSLVEQRKKVFAEMEDAVNNGQSHWDRLDVGIMLEASLPEGVKSLLSALLQPIPARRLTARAALEHPCFATIRDKQAQNSHQTLSDISADTDEKDVDSDCSESEISIRQGSTVRVASSVLFKSVARRIRVTKMTLNCWVETVGIEPVKMKNSIHAT